MSIGLRIDTCVCILGCWYCLWQYWLLVLTLMLGHPDIKVSIHNIRWINNSVPRNPCSHYVCWPFKLFVPHYSPLNSCLVIGRRLISSTRLCTPRIAPEISSTKTGTKAANRHFMKNGDMVTFVGMKQSMVRRDAPTLVVVCWTCTQAISGSWE